jgi:hypothetical protein
LNPDIEIVPPVLLNKSKVVIAEKYVPPVIWTSVPLNILHLAFSVVTPLTPSIVDPVQAAIKFLPGCDKLLTIVEYPD